MAAYNDKATSVSILARQSTEDAEVIALCKEYASLRDEPLTAAVKRFLREYLPETIAQLRAKVNPN